MKHFYVVRTSYSIIYKNIGILVFLLILFFSCNNTKREQYYFNVAFDSASFQVLSYVDDLVARGKKSIYGFEINGVTNSITKDMLSKAKNKNELERYKNAATFGSKVIEDKFKDATGIPPATIPDMWWALGIRKTLFDMEGPIDEYNKALITFCKHLRENKEDIRTSGWEEYLKMRKFQ